MERNDDRQLKVSAIKNGTVLDHIPSCQVFKVIDILGLSGSEHPLLTIPETICGIVKCINPMCVTNHEDIPTRFRTIVKGSEIQLECVYCEKITDL